MSTTDKPFGGYETAQDVVDAVAAGAIVRTEIIERALLALLGRDFVINFGSLAAQAFARRASANEEGKGEP
jgi:hypothetical protein